MVNLNIFMEKRLFRVFFVGAPQTGKTRLKNKILQIDEVSKPTVGIDFNRNEFDFKGQKIILMINDTSGEDRYLSIIGRQLKDADVVIFVYDIENITSFHAIDEYNKLVDANCPNLIVKFLIANANHADPKVIVTHEDLVSKRKEISAQISEETNCETGSGVGSATFLLLSYLANAIASAECEKKEEPQKEAPKKQKQKKEASGNRQKEMCNVQ
ncbi:ras-related protein Rab6 isoform X1 [Histomonas meleagridis]|uniref:ras-related protein Rab6 isoform X1 n=1 Tax=Histomonas meleagridis TaxID=135588 RepID=UPI00355AC942|nr:ras-related protein Rab6 isoform X1 [Histomonas meleagridis]KAH0799046.1 ras-related protein Rab6 isoform X1 [Histomonas meleagridis]